MFNLLLSRVAGAITSAMAVHSDIIAHLEVVESGWKRLKVAESVWFARRTLLLSERHAGYWAI